MPSQSPRPRRSPKSAAQPAREAKPAAAAVAAAEPRARSAGAALGNARRATHLNLRGLVVRKIPVTTEAKKGKFRDWFAGSMAGLPKHLQRPTPGHWQNVDGPVVSSGKNCCSFSRGRWPEPTSAWEDLGSIRVHSTRPELVPSDSDSDPVLHNNPAESDEGRYGRHGGLRRQTEPELLAEVLDYFADPGYQPQCWVMWGNVG